MNVLVTGGTGFIGSFLVETLVNRGACVRCLVLEGESLGRIGQLPVQWYYGDVSHRETLRYAVRSVDYVYHLAGVKQTWDETQYFRVNLDGTKNLVEACLSENRTLKRFLFTSSQAAAGPSRNGIPLTEDDACMPRTAYGRSKRAAEEYLLAHRSELPITIVRLALVYGPTNITTEKGLQMARWRFIPKIDQYINLIYIQDVIEALILAAEDERARGQLYFITNAEPVSLQDVVEQTLKLQNRTGFVVPIPRWLLKLVAQLGSYYRTWIDRPLRPLNMRDELDDLLHKYWICSGEKAKRELGFEPRVSLKAGIEQTLQWYEVASSRKR